MANGEIITNAHCIDIGNLCIECFINWNGLDACFINETEKLLLICRVLDQLLSFNWNC